MCNMQTHMNRCDIHVYAWLCMHAHACAHVCAAEGGAELVAVEQTRVRKKVGIAYELTRSMNTDTRTHTNVHA